MQDEKTGTRLKLEAAEISMLPTNSKTLQELGFYRGDKRSRGLFILDLDVDFGFFQTYLNLSNRAAKI
jgi:hypothetical protein